MTLPLITPLSPLDSDDAVPTYSSVQVRVTATLPATVDESTLEMAIGGTAALVVENYNADGEVTEASSTFKSLLLRTFTSADIGKSLFIPSAINPRNSGKCWITEIVSSNVVAVERPALTGTVSITSGTNTLAGVGTLFLSEVAVGDWLVIDDDYDNPLKVDTVPGDTSLTFLVNSSVTYTTKEFRPVFHTTNTVLAWKLQSFAAGFDGTIKTADGGANGFDLDVWPTKLMTGTVAAPEANTAIPTSTILSGVSSKFLSELHEDSNVTLFGKRTHEDAVLVTTVSNNTTAVIPAYKKVNTFAASKLRVDLAGLPSAGKVVAVAVFGRDSSDQLATLDPLAASQPVSAYQFTTSTRPKVSLANPQAANPFGLGIRAFFSENMLGYTATTNEAIADASTYTVAVITGTVAVPSPATPTVISVVSTGTAPSYVDVMLGSALVNGAIYRLTVKNLGLRATSGNLIAESTDNSIVFTGFGPVESVEAWKDTSVHTPSINGPQLVDYQSGAQTYEIHNLDRDVIAIELGVDAAGVEIVPDSFVNNHDGVIGTDNVRGPGTGTFSINFNSSLTSFRLSIQAIDDVDNVSLQSNVLGIVARAETVPGTSLSIRPLEPATKATCDRLLAGIPTGSFWLRAGYVLPYRFDPMPFTLKVLERGRPVTIAITRENLEGKLETLYQTVIPDQLTVTTFLLLGRGRNLIYATDGHVHDFIIVSAMTYATVLCTIATEIYNHAQVELEELEAVILSPVSSRIAEPYLDFSDMLPTPSVRSQQTLSTKLAIRSHIADSGTERAVRDLTTAISLQTPVVGELHNPKQRFWPAVEPVYTAQENFGGFNLHVWYHNECINRWSAFIRHIANSPERFRPVSISEEEILVEDQTGEIRRHSFDFSNPRCSSLSSEINCFDGLSVRLSFYGDFTIPVCAARYPFDSCFTALNRLGDGRQTFDSSIPWDSSIPLDYDLLDPGDDGWVGFCWADRWDSGTVLDSFDTGAITAGSYGFEDSTYTFTTDDINRWVRITSGSRQSTYKILTIISPTKARLDTRFDITETGLSWSLVEDVRVLDSMGPAPSMPIISFEADAEVVAGSETFETTEYTFTLADIDRNLIIQNLAGEQVSLIVKEILSTKIVRVERHTSATTSEPYQFEVTQSGLDWDLWDTTSPSCIWDGYANKTLSLSSSDIGINISPTMTLSLAEDTATLRSGYAILTGSAEMGLDDAAEVFIVDDTATRNGYAVITGYAQVNNQSLNTNGSVIQVVNATFAAVAEITAQSNVSKDAEADLEAVSFLLGTATGGTDAPVDTERTLILGQGWMFAESSVDFVDSATITGTATIAGVDLSQIHNGQLTLSALADLQAVGSIS